MTAPRRPTALITGRGRGIGQAVATLLVADHDLVIGYRTRRDAAEQTAAAALAQGAQVLVQACNIVDPASLAGLCDAVQVSTGSFWTRLQQTSLSQRGWSATPLGQ